MKNIRTIVTFFFFFTIAFLFAQQDNSQLLAYKQFLSQNKDMSYTDLKGLYNSGIYKLQVDNNSETYEYLDSVEIKYELTDYEKSLLSNNNFMVTERLGHTSFGNSFDDIFHKDLPVFISSDAILHAFHKSYDEILRDAELGILIGKLENILNSMNTGLSILESKYSGNAQMLDRLKDVDFYLTVPRHLLTVSATPYYSSNQTAVTEFLNYVADENFAEKKFLSEVTRKIDFSQFKVRGHYESEVYPQLGRYFKAMIWLGKLELYLIAPETDENKPTQEDVQRQTITAFLINELIDASGVREEYESFEQVIKAFVGEQDNVQSDHLTLLAEELEIADASDLLEVSKFDEFQNVLSSKSYAAQQILSQVLMNDPMTPDSIKPASAFMLFGQRFVIDSYVTANVVFDKIKFENQFIRRMLPSTLDILFAIGNDAAGQLLQTDLEEYKYSTNLAALRFLIDSHEDDFWNESIYNLWLNSIRALNPPTDRSTLPDFMQTAAWWQMKMNSQLGLWTELRHDNLLYAKQSYTGGVACSFPYGYVEPVPEFFNRLGLMAAESAAKINQISFENVDLQNRIINYFSRFGEVTDTLEIIAEKELAGTEFTEEEENFLQSILYIAGVCGAAYNGWYKELFYQWDEMDGLFKKDYIVADFHTAPTDASGSFVGWVKHAGTGPVDLAVVKAETPDGKKIAFVGPVISYYEYTTTNFQRLADSEWEETYQNMSLRPDWVNLYLAGKQGESLGDGAMLITGVDNNRNNDDRIIDDFIVAKNYPNPFNNGTIINFVIPSHFVNTDVEITVFDIRGRKIKTLLKENLQAGNYITRWLGKNEAGRNVSSGVYLYVIKAGSTKFTGKMNLMK